MKYKRLTKRIADGEEAFLFHSSLHEGIERLAELEDKIESGELCDREEVRKETAHDILSRINEYYLNYNYDLKREFEKLCIDYGVDLFA